VQVLVLVLVLVRVRRGNDPPEPEPASGPGALMHCVHACAWRLAALAAGSPPGDAAMRTRPGYMQVQCQQQQHGNGGFKPI
jgi:hypothetical protein